MKATKKEPTKKAARKVHKTLQNLFLGLLVSGFNFTKEQRKALQLLRDRLTIADIVTMCQRNNARAVGRPKAAHTRRLKLPNGQEADFNMISVTAQFYPLILPKCEATLEKFKSLHTDGVKLDTVIKQTRESLRKVGIKWPAEDWQVVHNFLKTSSLRGRSQTGKLARAVLLDCAAIKREFPEGISDRHLQKLILKAP